MYAVLGGQRLDLIAAGGRIQQVGGQLAVKAQRPADAAVCKRQPVEGLGVKGPDLGIAVQQGGQPVSVGQVDLAALHEIPAAVPGFGDVLRGIKAALQQQRQGRRLHRRYRVGVGGRSGGGAAFQPPAVDQLVHFQRGQQLRGGSRVAGAADIGVGVGLNGGIPADGAQHIGQVSLVAVGGQLGALAGLDDLVLKVIVHALQATEFRDQRQRGFFADARHAGNVVRRVTHQAFYINELGRLNAVFLPDGGGVHRDGLLVGRQQNGRGIVHQLQAVPVAGRQQRGAAGSLTGSSQRA